MKALGHMGGIGLAGLAPASMFLAQSWLIATGRPEDVLALAKYAGLLALLFFLFDGNSGLAAAIMRLRHTPAAIRSAYRVYRLGVLALLAMLLPLAWHFEPHETATLAPFCALALLLRLPFLDADLDRRNLQHWAMLLQNSWMLPLAATAVFFGPPDAIIAGHCMLWSSLIYAGFHWLAARTDARWEREKPAIREPLREILNFMAANGIGQVYGRAVLFVLGAGPASPAMSLIVYAKQLFNASGLVLAYLRRLELRLQGSAPSMQLSLWGQFAIGIIASVIIAVAAQRVGLPPAFLLLVIVWQLAERLSSTSIYAFQIGGRHDLAYIGLLLVVALGSAGLTLATANQMPSVFLVGELLGFAAVLALWASSTRKWRLMSESAR
jgi:hypothetical protein